MVKSNFYLPANVRQNHQRGDCGRQMGDDDLQVLFTAVSVLGSLVSSFQAHNYHFIFSGEQVIAGIQDFKCSLCRALCASCDNSTGLTAVHSGRISLVMIITTTEYMDTTIWV